jgi:hypothetical protein
MLHARRMGLGAWLRLRCRNITAIIIVSSGRRTATTVLVAEELCDKTKKAKQAIDEQPGDAE